MTTGAGTNRLLAVEMPGGQATRWVARILRLAWMPFVFAAVGRWGASTLDVLSSSLLAFAVVVLGGSSGNELSIPEAIMGWIRASGSPLLAALALALAVTLLVRIVQTGVQWCFIWTHLVVNRKLTPEVLSASLEPTTRRLLDPPTLVQRWLLKIDVSSFICESVAGAIGDIGTILIILIVTYRTNLMAGQVALGGLLLWTGACIPLVLHALRASRRAAQAHETVGRIIRDGAALHAELGRPSLRGYWQQRHQSSRDELHTAIKRQGLWNAALFGSLGLIAYCTPIVAVMAATATGSAASALAVLLYLLRMASPLESLASALPWLQQNLISVQRIFQVVVETEGDPTTRVAAIPFRPREVRVQDWAALMPDGSRITWPAQTVRRGIIQVVVGPSGSGKSSLLASLAAQLPATGSLLVDGTNVVPSDPRWRETCAYVPQEPELIPGGLMDNLRGFPGWMETPALKFAVDRVVASCLVGDGAQVAIDEKGVSAGQRRAIAVLRAIGSGAAVLLLDEPIAGVDDALVGPIREALFEANARGTLVITSAHEHDLHRLGLGGACAIVRLREIRAPAENGRAQSAQAW